MNEICHACGSPLLWSGQHLACPRRDCAGDPRGGERPGFWGRAGQITAPPAASPSEVKRGVTS